MHFIIKIGECLPKINYQRNKMGRKEEIMQAMSLSKAKNRNYPDATPAVHLALAQARKRCDADAAALAESSGADEDSQAAFSSMCLRNSTMITPVLSSSYFVRKEVLGWDCRV